MPHQFTITEPDLSKFKALTEPAQVVDERGQIVGHFVPYFEPPPEDQCPYTPAELARMRVESGGRSLDEILRDLGERK